MNETELLDNVKKLLRKSIATTLKIPIVHYETSMEAQTGVDRCLTMIMTLARAETLDDALDFLCMTGSLFNPNKISREAVQKEIMACLNTFRYEIALFKRMDSMVDAGETPESIWPKIQAMAVLGEDYKTNN